MSTEQVRLEEVAWKNYSQLIKLRISKEQNRFVARNTNSLIHAYLWLSAGNHVYPFGIYRGRKPIGFVMIGYNGHEEGDPAVTKDTRLSFPVPLFKCSTAFPTIISMCLLFADHIPVSWHPWKRPTAS